jgi:multidrug resistance protein MdtO
MMWLVFERFYSRPAADEMVRIFVRNLRLMAELVLASPAGDRTEAIVKVRRQRDQIYRYFGDLNAQADAVPFETGPARAGHMAARDRIRRWQASLRTFYLLEAPLLQFRLYADAHAKSDLFVQIEKDFHEECSRIFKRVADCLEKQLEKQSYTNITPCSLKSLLSASLPEETAGFSKRETALLGMSRTIASLVDRIQSDVASEALYATE